MGFRDTCRASAAGAAVASALLAGCGSATQRHAAASSTPAPSSAATPSAVGAAATPTPAPATLVFAEQSAAPAVAGLVQKQIQITFSGNQPGGVKVLVDFNPAQGTANETDLCGDMDHVGMTEVIPCAGLQRQIYANLPTSAATSHYAISIEVNDLVVAQGSGTTTMDHTSTLATSYTWP